MGAPIGLGLQWAAPCRAGWSTRRTQPHSGKELEQGWALLKASSDTDGSPSLRTHPNCTGRVPSRSAATWSQRAHRRRHTLRRQTARCTWPSEKLCPQHPPRSRWFAESGKLSQHQQITSHISQSTHCHHYLSPQKKPKSWKMSNSQ